MKYTGVISLLSEEEDKKYIYRIISFDHLVEWFETKKLPLLSPSKWEDPFEKFLMEAIFPSKEILKYEKGRMYGLCFSLDGISDALWRIYSHNQFGIRIKTTADLLSRAISTAPTLVNGRTYIGKVNYCGSDKLKEHARTIKNILEKTLDTKSVAETMLLKRTPFQHEKEIRVLHLTDDNNQRDDLLYFDIDPHTVIKTILLDPRATDQRVKALTRLFRDIYKFTGSIKQSETYKVPKL
ncbi:hypothetical protein HXX01_05185 [Candidatus Nomurabacteria bacterium]|nr:hypothetical protein [Candidatus Nomurabacteria bacterium]